VGLGETCLRRPLLWTATNSQRLPVFTTSSSQSISKPARTKTKCACGCGKEVVTPLSATDWKLIFDGKTVSLDPSIGNWGFPCRSHYWVRNNRMGGGLVVGPRRCQPRA
jgi:hypothetical protein